jgi:hypothetical protein
MFGRLCALKFSTFSKQLFAFVFACTVKVRLSSTLGEWGVPTDRFCCYRERWPTIRNFNVGSDEKLK